MRARHAGVRARVLTSEVQPCKVRWRLARARTQAYGSGSPPPVAERSVVIARGHPPALDRERVGASIEPGAHLFGFLRRRRGQRRALTGVHVRSRAASRWGKARLGWSSIHNEKGRVVIFAERGKSEKQFMKTGSTAASLRPTKFFVASDWAACTPFLKDQLVPNRNALRTASCGKCKIGWLLRTRRKPRQSVPLQNLSEPRR